MWDCISFTETHCQSLYYRIAPKNVGVGMLQTHTGETMTVEVLPGLYSSISDEIGRTTFVLQFPKQEVD
jgi:hypothetical protein